MTYKIHHGNNLDILPTLPDNSVDSIVTDPPYELGFMGKSWDSTGIAYNVQMWKECLRVLKPGGHLLAFSGSRTYHRMAVAIEDAGFQIRDQMMWVYGSGFPKSHNISKGIDKNARGNRVIELIDVLISEGATLSELGEKSGIPSLESSYRDWVSGGHRPEERSWERLLLGLGFSETDGLNIISRKTVSLGGGNSYSFREGEKRDWEIKATAPATEEAKQWEGWGTALKPAHEPIVLARKPIEGTVAENVLKWGVGGINIDGCRVGNEIITQRLATVEGGKCLGGKGVGIKQKATGETTQTQGRFPANFMHDGSQEVLELFPNDAGRFFYCPKANKKDRDEGCEDFETKEKPAHMRTAGGTGETSMTDGFQATQRKNTHPTVKPTELMRYLCRLITPPNGTVLDLFNGSGSTGKASVLEGFNYIGIELDPEYIKISEARINAALTLKK
jgi:DNA modification methylase